MPTTPPPAPVPPPPAPAANTNTPNVINCPYAIVENVMIQTVSATAITFSALSNSGTIATFSAADMLVWWTPHPHCPPTVRRQVGAVGHLYLHWNAWHTNAATSGGIAGFDPASP